MSIGDFIPFFLRQLRLKFRVQKKYGKRNNINTTRIGAGVSLGKKWGGVYLAENVEVRENVTIGDYSYCNKGTIIYKDSQIGNYCSIGYNVAIGPPEHPLSFYSTSPNAYRYDEIRELCPWPNDDITSPVVIGNDVWIGSNAIILQGCKVGDGSVVAAGAVVTHDVEPYTIVGGVPAKKIEDRFPSDLKKKLLENQWWNHDRKWISEFFHNLRCENKIEH